MKAQTLSDLIHLQFKMRRKHANYKRIKSNNVCAIIVMKLSGFVRLVRLSEIVRYQCPAIIRPRTIIRPLVFRNISVNIDWSSVLRTDSESLCNVAHYAISRLNCGLFNYFCIFDTKKRRKTRNCLPFS